MYNQGAVALMIAGALGPLVLFYWMSVTFFYYLHDKADIFQQLRYAKHAEEGHGTQSFGRTRSSTPTHKTLGQRLLENGAVICAGLNLFTISALFFKTDVHVWGEFATYGDIMLLNFASTRVFDDPGLVFVMYWIVISLFTLLFIVTIIRMVLRRTNKSGRRYLISIETVILCRHICLDVLFIPLLKRLFEMLDCTLTTHVTPDTISHLHENKNIVCWEDMHMFAGILAVCFIVVIFPIALHSTVSGRSTLYTRFLHIPKYYLFVISCQFVMVSSSIWPSQFSVPFATVFLVALAVFTIVKQPCIGDGRVINHVRSVSFACAAWVGLCSSYIVYEANEHDDDLSNTPRLVLVIGLFFVAVLAGWSSLRFADRLDTFNLDMVDALDISPAFDWERVSQEEVVKYSAITDSLVHLSLVTEHQVYVCDDHLSTCVSLLSGPLDSVIPYIAINVVVAVANLASNEACRTMMTEKGILPYILRLLHTSMTVRVQRVALCVVENLTFDNRKFVWQYILQSKLLPRLLPLLSRGDDDVQLSALQCLINVSQRQHSAIEEHMFTATTLHRIFNKLTARSPVIRGKVATLIAHLSARSDADNYRNMFLSAIERTHIRSLQKMTLSTVDDIKRPASFALLALQNIEVVSGPQITGAPALQPDMKSEWGSANVNGVSPQNTLTGRPREESSTSAAGVGSLSSHIPDELDNNSHLSSPLLRGQSGDPFLHSDSKTSAERSTQRRRRRDKRSAREKEREKLQTEVMIDHDASSSLFGGAIPRDNRAPSLREEGGDVMISGNMSDSDDVTSQKILYKKKTANLKRELARVTEELNESWDILKDKEERIKKLDARVAQMEKIIEREGKLRRLVEDSKNKCKGLTPVLGFQLTDVDKLTKLLRNGVRVGTVRPGKPAARAGLKENDIITHVGSALQSADDFKQHMSKLTPGDVLPLQVLRNKVQTLHIDILVEAKGMSVDALKNLRRLAREDVTLDDLSPAPESKRPDKIVVGIADDPKPVKRKSSNVAAKETLPVAQVAPERKPSYSASANVVNLASETGDVYGSDDDAQAGFVAPPNTMQHESGLGQGEDDDAVFEDDAVDLDDVAPVNPFAQASVDLQTRNRLDSVESQD